MKKSTFDYKPMGRLESYVLASLAKRISFVADYLVRRMDRLCVGVASKYTWYLDDTYPLKLTMKDLCGIASRGIRTAIRLYKPKYSIKFDTYATWHMREEIHKAIGWSPEDEYSPRIGSTKTR